MTTECLPVGNKAFMEMGS